MNDKKFPQPPPAKAVNTTYAVVVTRENAKEEYTRVRKVDMAPTMMILKWSDKEVIVPISQTILDIEISEEVILS